MEIDIQIAESLIEAFDHEETGILLWDKNDKLLYRNIDMEKRFVRLNVPYKIGESFYERIEKIRKKKLENYLRMPNVGSFFKNPLIKKKELKKLLLQEGNLKFYSHNSLIKVSAAWLIERCNLKGMQYDKARVSTKHSLVLINEDKSPNSILKLKNKIKNTVLNKYNIRLEEEPTII